MEKLELTGISACFNTGLLTAAGAETVYDTTVAIDYAIRGVLYRKATVADGATPTVDAVTAAAFRALTAGKGCTFLWLLDADGTVRVAQGSIEDLDAAGNFVRASQLPSVPEGHVPFAYTIVRGGSTLSGSWVFGTNNWNVAGITLTIRNLATLPDRPPVP